MIEEIKSHHLGDDKETVSRYLNDFAKADIKQKRTMLEQLKAKTAEAQLTKSERKQMRKVYRQELVKRSAVFKIAAAWIITVPASALMAAGIYMLIATVAQP
jgi:PiT family inorganic phosphate transporter